MYHIVIDIHHRRQIQQLEEQALQELINNLKTSAERWGMKTRPAPDLLLYSHPGLGPGEYEPLLKALFAIQAILDTADELIYGYSLIVEALEPDIDALTAFLPLISRVRERDGLYLGPNAEKLIARFLIGETFRGLWKILSRKEMDDQALGTAAEFVLRKHQLDSLFDRIEPWMNGERPPGEVYIRGLELDGVHLAGRSIFQRLTSAEALGRCPWAIIEKGTSLPRAFAAGINVRDLQWVDGQLSRLEAEIWGNKRFALLNAHPLLGENRGFFGNLSEQHLSDFQIAMQIYTRAYARWSRPQGNLPLVFIHLRRSLEAEELRFLKILMEEGMRESRLFWLISGEEEHLPVQPIALEAVELRLEAYSLEELQKVLDQHPEQPLSAAALLELSGGRALRVYQVLSDPGHYQNARGLENPEPVLHGEGRGQKTADRILMHALDRLDGESREVLSVLNRFGAFIDREQLFSFMEELGMARIRLTQILKDLQAKGFLVYEPINCTTFPEEIERISLHGDTSSRINSAMIDFICREDSSVRLHPEIARFLLRKSRQTEHIRLVYRYCQTLLESRRLDELELLRSAFYGNPSALAAVNLVDLHLSLSQGNLTAASFAPEPPEDPFWQAEWLLVQSQYLLSVRKIPEAKKQCKAAIIIYQQLQDPWGLHMANIIFGYLHLIEGRHQDACHYFLTGEGSADRRYGDQLILLSRFLPCLSDFSEGKFSQVRKVLEGSQGLLERLDANGAHGWAAAVTFLGARTYFALGLYQQAYVLLSRLLNGLHGEHLLEIRRVLYIWMARSLIHDQRPEAGVRILDNLPQTIEVRCYLAEEALLADNHEKALELLRETGDFPSVSLPVSPFLPWNCGFSWIEDIFVQDQRQEGVLVNYLAAMRARSLGFNQGLEESIQHFHYLTREKKIRVSDPHLPVILYWYSQVLELSQDNQGEDRLTLLGRAVKALQERSSRIEEPSDKREFLNNVRWNRELLGKAKRFNLV